MKDILQRYHDMENNGIGIYFDADEIIELLEYFEDMEDFDHFIKVVKIGQKLHPHNIDIKVQICKGYIYNNNFEKALALIKQLSDTENQDLKVMKCECFCALDRYEELLACLETIKTDLDDELEEIYEYLAHILRDRYESKNAYDFVKYGMTLFPNNVTLKEELCYHLDMHYEMEKAIEVCKELIDSNPYNIDYWYILGRLYAITEAYDKAIEAFDFALISDETDLEVKILKAFCYFMKEDFEQVIEVYTDVFPAETNVKSAFIQSRIHSSDNSEFAYKLIKKMIKSFDILEIDNSQRYATDNQNEDETNGLLSIADCFPGSLSLLLFNELILMAEGKEDAINNIEQIIQMIYRNGTNNTNFQMDVKSKCCMLSKQKLYKLLQQQIPNIDSGENDDCIERQIMKHLLDGNTNMFCQLYAQSSSEAISEYLEKIFPGVKKRKKQHAFYLGASEIYRNEHNYISSSELSAKFMTNKNLHN